MKRKFLVIYDYEHGGGAWISLAHSREQLEELLEGCSGITIIENDIENHHLVKFYGDKIQVCDAEKPTGLLKTAIEVSVGNK